MTRKLSDLADFITLLKKEGYTSQISLSHLKYYIAMEIGVSEYTIKNIVKSLIQFGFIEQIENSFSLFKIKNGVRLIPTSSEQKENERKASLEANKLLNKVGDGLVDTGRK